MGSPAGQFFRLLQRHQNLLIIISLVLVALPFMALSFYNHPSLDDMLDAATVQRMGFWAAQKYFYLTLTGRYTTTLLLALVNPLLYGRLETSWWWVTLAFIGGTLLVLRLVLAALPGLSNGAAWRAAGLLLGLWLAYAPGQSEGLYWFTGAYTYVATAWLLLLWLVALGRYVAVRRTGQGGGSWLAALAALTVAVAGTTEPVALPFLLVLLLGAALSLWLKQGRIFLLLAGLAATGCIVSFRAPGNAVRMAIMAVAGEPFGLTKALAYSAASTAYLLLAWVGNPVLLALSALLLPNMSRMAQRRSHWLVVALSHVPAGLLAAGLSLLLMAASSPAFYASGTGLPLRARTTLYLLFLVGWFGVLLVWCCRQARLGQPAAVLNELGTGRLAPLWVGLLALFFVTDYNLQTRARMLGQGSNNVVRAYRQWLGGEAARYDAELRARYQSLATGGPVVRIQPLQHRPDLLFCFDVGDLRNPAMLQDYAQYFGVQRVITTAP